MLIVSLVSLNPTDIFNVEDGEPSEVGKNSTPVFINPETRRPLIESLETRQRDLVTHEKQQRLTLYSCHVELVGEVASNSFSRFCFLIGSIGFG